MKGWREDPGRHMGKAEENQNVLGIIFHRRLREFGGNIPSVLKVHLVSLQFEESYRLFRELVLAPDPV